MNINIIFCIIFFLIISTYYINKFLNVKEGIIFSKDYFLDKYEKDGITIDKLNFILEKDGKKINAKNMMDILMLASGYRSQIEILVDGDDEKIAVKEIKSLFSDRFGEES